MKFKVTPERFRAALPRAIVLLREARGLTQAELARRLSISSATMCRYEKGNYKPGIMRLAEILEVLEWDFGDLDAVLNQVWRGDAEISDAVPGLLLPDDVKDEDKLVSAYAANVEDRGEKLMAQAIRQARALTRLLCYVEDEKKWQSRSADADGKPRTLEAN